MEATYVADDEARLRHDLEEKGLFLLSVQGGGALKIGKLGVRMPRRRDRKSTRLNSSHVSESRMPSSA